MAGIKHANAEVTGGELTAAEWSAAHTIEAGSIDFNNVNLFEQDANTLATDDSFHIGGNLIVDGNIPLSGFSETGVATIDATNTIEVVTHSLGNDSFIVVPSWTSDLGGKRWWIAGKTSSQFTIAIDSPYSSAITFDYGLVDT